MPATVKNVISVSLITCADSLLNSYPEFSLIVCGDFNTFNCDSFSLALDLINIVDKPTRGNNTLDKIYISRRIISSYENCNILPPIGKSDHDCVYIKESLEQPSQSSVHIVKDLRQSNIEIFVERLANVDFTFMYRLVNIEDKLNIFYEILNSCLDVIPHTTVQMSPSDKPWMTPVLKSLINKRWNAFRNKNFGLYNHLKTKIKLEILNAKNKWASKSAKSSRTIWKVINDTRGKTKNIDYSFITNQFSSLKIAVDHINCNLRNSFTEPIELQNEDIHLSNSVEDWCPGRC